MLPQKLYKYCAFSTQSLRLLTRAEAYYADPRCFNDPLDCQPTVQIDVDRSELERLCYKLLRRTKEREAAIAAINELRYLSIPSSRQNPKILWVDDAEVVRDRIAQLRPVLRDFLA